MTDETHWPARTVAEYAYCPRLFYYMEVEGVFLPSVDTEKGQAVHRRVNKRSAELQENSDESEGSDRPKTVRSLVLTSDKLGLTATLDLAELSGNIAVPVEYRKGAPKRTAIANKREEFDEEDEDSLSVPEPWPTDRVQVGLQALLLGEAGYEVKEAVLHYAAEKLRLTIPVDSALKSEALATLEAANICSQGPRPLPLVNDPRCIRCSLQPICLPDEVNCERSEAGGDHISPRKIWPPRDEGIQIVAQQNGTRVGVKGMALTIGDANGKTGKKEVPLASVDGVSLLGSVQISTQAMRVLADQGIPVAMLSAAGRLVAMVDPLDSVSALVRRKQVLTFESPEKCLELARALVNAKIANQRRLLIRNHAELPAEASSGIASRLRGASGCDLLRAFRGDAEWRAGNRIRCEWEKASSTARSRELVPFNRVLDSHARMRVRVACREAGAFHWRVPHFTAWSPGIGIGPDGAFSPVDCGLHRNSNIQSRGTDKRPFPADHSGMHVHGRWPKGVLPSVRAPNGYGSHASGLWIQVELSANAGPSRPHDRCMVRGRNRNPCLLDHSLSPEDSCAPLLSRLLRHPRSKAAAPRA
jgi:CRISPR-associated protein Cas1